MTWTKLGDEYPAEARDLTSDEFRLHVEALCWSNLRLLDLLVPKRDLRRLSELDDPEGASADIRVSCAQCGEPFRWIGVPAGLKPDRPMVSVDEKELHAPLRPASADPDFGLGIPGFAIRYRDS